jgi:Domain of unknown function (DUF5753)
MRASPCISAFTASSDAMSFTSWAWSGGRPSQVRTGWSKDRAVVEVRLARQQVLTGPDPLRLSVVVDEAALRRPAGSEETMRRQMTHLLETAELPRVTLQVIPFRRGRHPGSTGPFTILEFPEQQDPEAVYLENLAGELFVEEPADVDRFRSAFERLAAIADSPEDTIHMIAGLTQA